VPGTRLSQVALADQLGVSRTPLPEVLRMLQEEGLVEIEPNQRTRVAGLDPQELDDVYASRILLETLALSMTLEEFAPARQRETRRMLTAMRQAAKTGDFGTWFSAHAEFHRLIAAGAGNCAATAADRVCGPHDPLHPDLPAIRADELAVGR
jgi:DNA-binding GntR family transcriptional regulator